MHHKNKKKIIIIIVILLIVVLYFYNFPIITKKFSNIQINDFVCEENKSISATFTKNEVNLTLSDGRVLTLPQVISASGARYANKDETFVFWNKGVTALITEGKSGSMTYKDCAVDK